MLAGVGAIVLLIALTVGVPIALITVVGLPLPHTVPKLSALTSQLDITAILRILSVIVWLAWIQLVWCVLVEIKAAASGKQGHAAASPKVPLAGATQSLAHRLVTAALLLFTAAAALTPAVISHGPPRPAPSVSAQVTPAQLTPAQLTPAIPVTSAGLAAAQAPPSHHHAPNSDKMYTVNPPVGRFHESLWEIAHNHLGDGRRYREIFELNSERVQPDGSKLTIASLIRPGWQLLMPKDAHGPGIEAVTPKLAGELGLAGHPSQRHAGTEDPELPVGQAQAERLLALARSRYRMGFGYVIAGDIRGATWSWDLSGEGRLHADALGFDLEAQLLPPEQYAAVVKLFRGAAAGADVPLAALAQAGAAPAEHLAADTALPVEVGLLGHLEVQAPGPLEPDRLALATELVVYLAAHPDGVHANVLTGAVWPRGVSNEVRDAALSRVHAWLGTDEQGQPNLVTDESGRYRLGPGARVDWQVFRALFARASQAAAASDPAAEAGYLERALTLVRGQFLDGRDPARYAWLATDEIEYEVTAAVAAAAHRLSALRLAAGDPDGAMEAARAGLRLAFNDEILWRDLLTGAHATGQEHVLRAVVGEISARVALDEVMPRMAPETEALIDELLPSWRTSAA